MMKTKFDSFGPLALAQPSTPSRPCASAGHCVAHAEAQPSWPTTHDRERPMRGGSYARTPPKY